MALRPPFVGFLFTIPIWDFYAFASVPPQLLLPYGCNPSFGDARRAECAEHFSSTIVLHPMLPLARLSSSTPKCYAHPADRGSASICQD
jgi:hypothetical protein